MAATLRRVLIAIGIAGVVVLLPRLASAQADNSAIAGQVRDTSGAVMPGVTVEAASPALIDKVRSSVTDDQGQYRIGDLRPGVYSVTFTLPGFSTVKREAVELPASFTATINVELKVGAVEETITVSGAAPVVDVRNATPRARITAESLDLLPTNKTLEAFITLTPGMTNTFGNNAASAQDVGGSKGETYVTPAIHGGHGLESRTVLDGFETNNPDNGGGGRVFIPNPMSTQEVSMALGSGTVESQTSGVQINFVPRDGGNTYHGSVFGNFTNGSLQSAANLSQELKDLKVTQESLPKIGNIWDTNGGLGGPLKRDRLWFFTAHRSWGSANTVVGQYENAQPADSWLYTKDLSKPAINDFVQQNDNIRLTWQASARHRLNFSYDYEYRCDCHRDVSATTSPSASRVRLYYPQITSITWTFPATNRILLEAGTQLSNLPLESHVHDGQSETTIPVVESSTNLSYRASTAGYGVSFSAVNNTRASASFVTRAHSIKAGFEMRNPRKDYETHGSPISYTLRNGSPTGITLYAYPQDIKASGLTLAGYVQDQWTVKRLTINPGIRLDHLNAWVPAVHLAAGTYVPARDYAEVTCVPCWTNYSPRVSLSYDVFGNGKTAVKGSFGRYLGADLLNLADANNPQNASNPTATRSWQHNGDFVPQENELGPLNPGSFGTTTITTHYAADVLRKNRPYNYQTSLLLQHEVSSGVAASVGYFRTSWRNFRATDNLDIAPTDFDPYCITLPSDVRLPNGGGNQVCGLYDINPTKFGVANNLLVTEASHYGKQTEVYNGMDLTLSARLPRGAFLQGGMSTGRTETDRCFVVDNPQSLLFCHVKPPFWKPQVKISGSYRLPWSLQASAVFQSLPGIPISASYVATNAEVLPTLHRALAGGNSTVTISDTAAALGTAAIPGFSFPSPGIIPPQTMFENRSQQLDLRFERRFGLGQAKLRAMFDVYNLLNSTPILGINSRYGTAWLTPTFVLDARIFKFGAQLDF